MLRSYPEIVQASLRLPHGNDAMWALIKELDAAGPWTMRQLEYRTNLSRGALKRFVKNLVANGFAEIAGEEPVRGLPGRQKFSLLRRPVQAPRFGLDGRPLEETKIETLWRTMKFAKAFTSADLASLASTEARPIPLGYVKQYVTLLLQAKVLVVAAPHRSNQAAIYRLVRNLGARAPMVLEARVLFDPNANAVLVDAGTREVSS
ncbi:MAG: hypothetical protein DI629_03605 [Mesorhizobium amorphae]|nr:MAG: hypothetical protein DI629_03605 [Mesorhizobium amorphae]